MMVMETRRPAPYRQEGKAYGNCHLPACRWQVGGNRVNERRIGPHATSRCHSIVRVHQAVGLTLHGSSISRPDLRLVGRGCGGRHERCLIAWASMNFSQLLVHRTGKGLRVYCERGAEGEATQSPANWTMRSQAAYASPRNTKCDVHHLLAATV